MGKKSSQSPKKTSKHEKKQQLNSLIKILRPKVYITDSSNFKRFVQELTGNGTHSLAVPSPSPPAWEETFPETETHHHRLAYKENRSSIESSFDTSCLATPLEGSPDFSLTESSNYEMGNSLDRQMEFFKDFEAQLMGMDSGFDCDSNNACYGMFQQEQVCVYDYGLSTFV